MNQDKAKTVLGVVLARAGSVGLASKHLRPLCSRPVIQYTFDHTAGARLITHLAVTTDCPGVAGIARQRGLRVIDRPAELATSDASVQRVMLHAMHAMERTEGCAFDALVVLYGNVPVRGEGVIDRAIAKLLETGCDSVRSFCPVGKWHPAWMSRLREDRAEPLEPGSIHRRQDLPPLFLHDGAVVAVSRASMLRGEKSPTDPHAFFGIDRRGIETSIGETVEIDHARDLYWAEAVLRDRGQQTESRVA